MHTPHRQSQTLGHIPKQLCKETKLFFPPLFLCIFMPRLNSTFVFSLWMWNRSLYLLLFLFVCINIHRSTRLLRIEPVSSERRRELLFVTSWKYFEMNLKSGVCDGWLPLCVVAGEGGEKQESEVSGELCFFFLSQRWVQRAWQQTIKGQVMRKLWQQHNGNSKQNSISNFFGSFPCFNFSDLQKCIN